jgi:uncharacterized protein (DUF1697 family)
MPTHIVLLRAVNLGPHNKVAMADLRELAEGLGFQQPRTLVQSGNLVFRNARPTGDALETLLEREAARRLGLETAFFARTSAEWQAIVEGNPFTAEARRDPSHLVLLCLKAAPTDGAVERLQAAITGRESVRGDGRQAYVVYPDGIGRSKLTTAMLERRLGTAGTGRNWNTVLKLAALAGS